MKRKTNDSRIAICIATCDPLSNTIDKIYYMLGNVPNKILCAAKSGKLDKKKNINKWDSTNSKILSDYYGKGFEKHIQGFIDQLNDDTSYKYDLYGSLRGKMSFSNVIGGEEDTNDESSTNAMEIQVDNDIFKFNDEMFNKIEQETDVHKVRQNEITTQKFSKSTNAHITYNNLSLWPEDTILDLRRKIYLLTGIPVYRQFIFYYINDQGPYYTYQIYINRIAYKLKWNDIITRSETSVNGIGIDLYFEQYRNNIEVVSYETQIINSNIGKITKAFVIDLQVIIDYYGLKNVTDTYQFNLLYYGFIYKYWPQLTKETFKYSITTPTSIKKYPLLYEDFSKVFNEETIKNDLFDKIHSSQNTSYDAKDTFIKQINIAVFPNNIKTVIDIRNIFDMFELDSVINMMILNIKSSIYKKYVIIKKHLSVVDNQYAIHANDNTIDIFIDKVQSTLMSISTSGSYTITTEWLESDKINLLKFINILKDVVNPVVDKINSFKEVVFPTGGSLKYLDDDYVLNNITFLYNFDIIMTINEFNSFKNFIVNKYEKLEIIMSNNIQFPRMYMFTQYRGVNNMYSGVGYEIFYEETKLNGRKIKIAHRSDRLQIEFIKIQSVEEFDIIFKYITYIVNEFVTEKKIKKFKNIDESVKSIKRLHDIDPALYDLAKYDNTQSKYSVLCQSGRQPLVYNEDYIKTLPESTRNKMVKYWNFTKNEPAYYLCNSRFPYINFIIGKHPKNYCLPCCKKLKDIPGTHVAHVNEKCLKNKQYDENKTKSSEKYVLSFSKSPEVGRLSNLPSFFKDIFPGSYILGVTQSYPKNQSNISFIECVLTCFPDCFKQFISAIKEHQHYYILGNGVASKFNSQNEMINDMIYNFIDKNNMLMINSDIDIWSQIIIDLVRIIYNTQIITIIYDSDDNCSIVCSKILLSYINKPSTKLVFFIKTLGLSYNLLVNGTKFFYDKSIWDILYKAVIQYNDFDIMKLVKIANSKDLEITTFFIDLHDMCYGAQVGHIYIPVLKSQINTVTIKELNKNIKICYNVRPEPTNSRKELLDLVSIINKPQKYITHFKDLLFNNEVIGFETIDHLRLYHKPINVSNFRPLSQESFINLYYDPRTIDKLVFKKEITEKISQEAKLKMFSNNLYKLFLSEFVNICSRNKNNTIRSKILKIINDLENKDLNMIYNIKVNLSDVLKNYQVDYNVIQEFIEFIFYNNIAISNINKFIHETRFEFDYDIIEKLRSITPKEKLIKELKIMMKDSITPGDIKKIDNYYNIYVSCSVSSEQFFCKGTKLLIPEELIEDLFDILADDIYNKSKLYVLISSSFGILDYFNFTKRSTEIIEILESDD